MRITKVEYVSEYKLKLTFNGNEVKIVDLSQKMKDAKGIFAPLKDLEYFRKVSVDDCQLSICWPNGADICPDVLYDMATPASGKQKAPKRKISIDRNQKIKSRRSKTPKIVKK